MEIWDNKKNEKVVKLKKRVPYIRIEQMNYPLPHVNFKFLFWDLELRSTMNS